MPHVRRLGLGNILDVVAAIFVIPNFILLTVLFCILLLLLLLLLLVVVSILLLDFRF